MSLADALERAAESLGAEAEAIRPANGDPVRLLEALGPEGARRVLAWLLEDEAAAGEELALAWAELPDGERVLGAVEEGALPKAGRKALRRALHRLRARGVELARPEPGRVVAKVPEVDETLAEGAVTRIDPSGAQLLVLAESQPGGGVRVVEAIVEDEAGILEFHVLNTGRSAARRLLRELGGGRRLPAVAAPPSAVLARLARVAARQPSDRPFPRSFLDWRGRIERMAGGRRTPGEEARSELGEAGGAEARERVLGLIEAGDLGPWPPPVEEVRRTAERLHEVASSRLVLSEEQRRESAEEVLQALRESRFGEAGAHRTADRLEECAYAFWREGREEDARACLTMARELREGPAAEHPVARALLDRALRPMIEALRQEEESSLVVKP